MPFDAAAMRINPNRFGATFEALTRGGAAPGGLDRPCLSEAHPEARHAFRDLDRRSGFDVTVDGAGNHSAVLRCKRDDAPTLQFGLHLDSTPNGGRYDGAFSVAAAIETLQSIAESALAPDVHLEVIGSTDEEGTWGSLMGSRADHACTSSMDGTLDAAQGAAAFSMAVGGTVMERFPDCRAHIGRMMFSPGAFMPERVTLSLEHRSGDRSRALKLDETLRSEALGVELEFLKEVHPAQMDHGVRRALESSADRLGLTHRRLPSLAGHDADLPRGTALSGAGGRIQSFVA